MPIGTNSYTCFCCRKSEICGDYIPFYCDSCDSEIRKYHNGKLPSIFDSGSNDFSLNCPCSNCIRHKNQKSIEEKLSKLKNLETI